eukprot:NODE_4689_length_1859_cov_10.312933.p1 GENE.NODE_4689_length_1859_cov_10.312933~~NODE_4689_length_1859_cov_10.312933.p1  ORF type:complete len:527 (-),score=-29.46 NODE_4689_length_1859_cov_10.312933:227-1807(-)
MQRLCAKTLSVGAFLAVLGFALLYGMVVRPIEWVRPAASEKLQMKYGLNAMTLTKEQLETYHSDGVLHLKGVLPANLTSQFVHALEKLQFDSPVMPFITVKFGNWMSPFLFDFAREKFLSAMAAQVMGTNTVRFLYDPAWELLSGKAGIETHSDSNGFWTTGQAPGMGFWIPGRNLTNCTGGSMKFARGTHRPEFRNHCRRWYISPDLETNDDACVKWYEDVATELEEVNIGDVILFDKFILHGSAPFKVPDQRRLSWSPRYADGSTVFYPSMGPCITSPTQWVVAMSQGMVAGDPLSKIPGMFPQVYPAVIPEEQVLPSEYPYNKPRRIYSVFQNIAGFSVCKLAKRVGMDFNYIYSEEQPYRSFHWSQAWGALGCIVNLMMPIRKVGIPALKRLLAASLSKTQSVGCAALFGVVAYLQGYTLFIKIVGPQIVGRALTLQKESPLYQQYLAPLVSLGVLPLGAGTAKILLLIVFIISLKLSMSRWLQKLYQDMVVCAIMFCGLGLFAAGIAVRFFFLMIISGSRL